MREIHARWRLVAGGIAGWCALKDAMIDTCGVAELGRLQAVDRVSRPREVLRSTTRHPAPVRRWQMVQ